MATMKLHAGTWNTLTADERAEITRIVTASGFADDITPDSAAPPPGTATDAFALGSFCTILCSIVEGAAKLACERLSGTAKELCLIAAKQGGELCRSKCNG